MCQCLGYVPVHITYSSRSQAGPVEIHGDRTSPFLWHVLGSSIAAMYEVRQRVHRSPLWEPPSGDIPLINQFVAHKDATGTWPQGILTSTASPEDMQRLLTQTTPGRGKRCSVLGPVTHTAGPMWCVRCLDGLVLTVQLCPCFCLGVQKHAPSGQMARRRLHPRGTASHESHSPTCGTDVTPFLTHKENDSFEPSIAISGLGKPHTWNPAMVPLCFF